MPDPVEILAEHWPHGGPHDRETLRTAVESAAVQLRYAANATDPVNARATIETAGDVHRIVASLHEAVGYLPQLLTQLDWALLAMAPSGALRDERDPGETYLGRDLAYETIASLGEALPAVHLLLARLAEVQRLSTHLGTVEPTTAGPTHAREGGPR